MTSGFLRFGSRHRAARALVPAIALLVIVGCSSDDNNTSSSSGGATTYEGTLVGSGDSGSLEVTIMPASSPAGGRMVSAGMSTASGHLTLRGGCTVDLTGTFDGMTLALQGTGTCGTFSLVGVMGSGRIEGTFTGPAGRTGSFVIVLRGSGESVQVFCGTWVEYEQYGGHSGPWNMLVKGSSLSGVAYSTEGQPIPLSGTRSGNAVTIEYAPTQQQIATGTIDGSSISGTFDTTANGGGAGTWSGGACQ